MSTPVKITKQSIEHCKNIWTKCSRFEFQKLCKHPLYWCRFCRDQVNDLRLCLNLWTYFISKISMSYRGGEPADCGPNSARLSI